MRALITGITGQDGSYLAEFLLEKNYEVHGLVRRTSERRFVRLEHISEKIKFVEGDLTDPGSLDRAVQEIQPDELYNLAAQSFVPVSWTQPSLTAEVTGLGVLRILQAVQRHSPQTRFLQASSSEMFGKVRETPQKETTPFYPRSPYGVAKTFGHYMTINFRESYGLFACACIAFNHESPRRGKEFITRKVTRHIAEIKYGLADKLRVGNLDAQRDWGFAGDYVRAMWLMLQQLQPDEYVLATGKTHSVRELLEVAFSCAELDWRDYVEVDPALLRPAEVDFLSGDSTKAQTVLGWTPEVSFEQMIEMMVQADIQSLEAAGYGQRRYAAAAD
jgi:GDPmannose 4,6-dehydratase